MGVRARQWLIAVVGAVLTVAMLWLGLWQMRVFEDKENESAAARAAQPAVPLLDFVSADGTVGDIYGKPASVTGHYLPAQQARIRAEDGTVRVLTAFQVADGRVLAVVRGVLPAGATTIPEPPAGELTQTGVFLPSEAGSGQNDTGTELGTVRLPVLAQFWPQQLLPGFITLPAAESAAQGLGDGRGRPAERLRVDPEHRLRAAVVGLRGVRRLHDRAVHPCAEQGRQPRYAGGPGGRMSSPAETVPALTADQAPGVRGALLRYRIMAYVVGTLLVVLVVVGVPLKYFGNNGIVVTLTGVPHGWLYMVLLITAYDLGRRVHWPWGRLLVIALAGTVPFLSFWAEYSARKDVQARLKAVEASAAQDRPLRTVRVRSMTIIDVTPDRYPECLEVLRAGFATEVADFGITRENTPSNPAFWDDSAVATVVAQGLRPVRRRAGGTDRRLRVRRAVEVASGGVEPSPPRGRPDDAARGLRRRPCGGGCPPGTRRRRRGRWRSGSSRRTPGCPSGTAASASRASTRPRTPASSSPSSALRLLRLTSI